MDNKKFSVVLRRVRRVVTEVIEKAIVPCQASDDLAAGVKVEEQLLNDRITLDSLHWTPMWVESEKESAGDPVIVQVIEEKTKKGQAPLEVCPA